MPDPFASRSQRFPAQPSPRYRLTVNTYDRTATWIIALLVLVGITVLGLLVVYFAKKTFPAVEPIPVVPVEATSPHATQGFADEPDPPGAAEAPDLLEPQLQDTLTALTQAASSPAVLLAEEVFDADRAASRGQGAGDTRLPGPAGDGVVERVPRWQRWKIRFEPASAGDFARWLDYHRIELGVLGRDNRVHYATGLSTANPQIRQGAPHSEQRGYTSAADGPLPALTQELARQVGIASHGSTVLLFYPLEIESRLHALEEKTLQQTFAGRRDVNAIRETIFTVIREGSDFRFEVVDQKIF